MNKRLASYPKQMIESILPALRPFFDQVTFETKDRWLMQIWYGDKSIFESFETYELNPHKEEKAFNKKKLRLFLDGVYLYFIHSNERIELKCNAYNDDYYLYR